MSNTFDDTKDLEIDGGDDTHAQTTGVSSARVAIQPVVTGDTSDFDFVIDVRLADDADWVRDFESLKNKSAPFTGIARIDGQGIYQLRARVINKDGNNTATSRLIARSDTQGGT